MKSSSEFSKIEKWQNEIRNDLACLIGQIKFIFKVDYQILKTEELKDYKRIYLEYFSFDKASVPAYMLIPHSIPEKAPAVLCMHQHNNEYHLGKEEPAGLAGNPLQSYAHDLALEGYITFAFDQHCFGEREGIVLQGMDFERFEFLRMLTYGYSLQKRFIGDAAAAVSLLQSLPEVDPERIGSIGHSMGGQQTLFTAAFDQRIKVMVSSCGFGSLQTIIEDNILHNFGAYIPGFLKEYDMDVFLKLCAPRPFLITCGRYDPLFPVNGVKEIVDSANETYREFHAGDQLQILVEECQHQFSVSMHSAAYNWIKTYL